MIDSWDLFDTLVARQCGRPDGVFEIIEKEKNIPNFKDNRMKNEKNTLEETYSILKKKYGWDEDTTRYLIDYEMRVEEDNIFPIYSNIVKVKPEDIIVSDMYLPLDFLKKICEKYGIKNKIYVSNGGKSRGYIWDIIKKDGYLIKTHYGDNINSDVLIPKRYGISTVPITNSDFTVNELKFATDIRKCMRYVRLQDPYLDPTLSRIYQDNCQYNIPLLLYFCKAINDFVVGGDYKKILFSTRDCMYLYTVFKKLYGSKDSSIFFTSRKCYFSDSPDYDEYVDSLKRGKTLVVDMQGTGNSFRRYFLNTRGLPDVDLLFFNSMGGIIDKRVNSLFTSKKIGDSPEILNLCPFGSVSGINKTDDDTFLPCLDGIEYPTYIIEPIETCVGKLIEYLDIIYPESDYNSFLQNIEVNSELENLKLYLSEYNKIKGIYGLFENQDGVKSTNKKCNDPENILDYKNFREKFGIDKNDDGIVNFKASSFNPDHHKIEKIPCFVLYSNLEKLHKKVAVLKNIGFQDIYVEHVPENIPENVNNSLLDPYIRVLSYKLPDRIKNDVVIFDDSLSEPVFSDEISKKIVEFSVNYAPKNADMIYFEFCNESCKNKFSKNFTRLENPKCHTGIYYPNKNTVLSLLTNHIHQSRYLNIPPPTLDEALSSLQTTDSLVAYTNSPIFEKQQSFCTPDTEFQSVYGDLFSKDNELQTVKSYSPPENRLPLIFFFLAVIILTVLLARKKLIKTK